MRCRRCIRSRRWAWVVASFERIDDMAGSRCWRRCSLSGKLTLLDFWRNEYKGYNGKSYKYGITQNITYGCVAEWSMALASGANIFVCMGSNPISVNLFFAILALQWMHMRLCNHVHFFVVVVSYCKGIGAPRPRWGWCYVQYLFCLPATTFFYFPTSHLPPYN